MGASLQLEGVGLHYGDLPALDGVDLEVGAGEAVALVGPSGSGKTTLLRLFNAFHRPDRGRVLVDGRDLAELSSRELRAVRASIGFVHQDFALVPNLRVITNVVSGRLGRMGWFASWRAMLRPGEAATLEAHEILERVGVGEKIYQRVDALSGGQRQRVAIARSLYQRPEALMADEPVSSVDPARARDTVQLLTEISRERGLTLLMSLHDLPLAREFFPRVVGMRAGRVLFDAAAGDLAESDFRQLYRLEGSPDER